MTSHGEYGRLFEALRTRFAGRLAASLLEDAVAYWKFAEYGLGIEALCDYLAEHRVPLDDGDVNALEHAAVATNADLNRIRVELAGCPRRSAC